MSGHWRREARAVCSDVVAYIKAQSQPQTPKQVRSAFRRAYPFGERRMWPYKVWLSEVRRHLLELRCYKGRRLVFPDAKIPMPKEKRRPVGRRGRVSKNSPSPSSSSSPSDLLG